MLKKPQKLLNIDGERLSRRVKKKYTIARKDNKQAVVDKGYRGAWGGRLQHLDSSQEEKACEPEFAEMVETQECD